ncbi:MAG: 50S ribosomal protein L23 [Alphaproteobacteria bacterium]|nr:MAG: 50S ribosomal protein L23 [Alphaproteobacteria bacterium]
MAGADSSVHFGTLLSPVITEKSSMISGNGQYVFRVPLAASKPQIKAAVEAVFKVKVEAVNTLRSLGKTKARKGRKIFRSDSKKAVVTLADGQSIDVATGV